METVEEVVVAPPRHLVDNDLSPVAKGKRTKRQRPHSPLPFTLVNNNHNHRPCPSFSAASTADSITTEEEDTARCLVLLSQGHLLYKDNKSYYDLHHAIDSKPNNRRPQTAASGGGSYACKTCNRVFTSFQALGGHRTSHKKPKNDKKAALFPDFDDDFPSPSSSKKRIPPSLSLQLSSTSGSAGGVARQLPSPRIHECSYCGAEFASGQALGGHMRRHRAGPTSPLPVPAAEVRPPEPKKPRNGISLDLNFPAPEDENQRFGYGSGVPRREKSPEKMAMSTTTPALVDCHY